MHIEYLRIIIHVILESFMHYQLNVQIGQVNIDEPLWAFFFKGFFIWVTFVTDCILEDDYVLTGSECIRGI